MRIDDNILRTWYLLDLQNPDTFHGRTTPKVRNLEPWKNITSIVPETPRVIDPHAGDVWVWSDIHFGHNNIIKYTAPHRPFASKEEMNEALIANYLKVVKPGDTVIWGGDIGFMSEGLINNILSIMHGYNIWIVGNHDMHRDGTPYKLHFQERHLCKVVDIKEPDGFQYQLLFTHYPLDKVPPGCQNVHGHIHQNVANSWNINICVEHTNCAPLNLRDVCARARAYLETT